MKLLPLYIRIITFLALLGFNQNLSAQELIQLIDFTTDNYIEVNIFEQECDLPNSPQNDGTFEVVNGRIELHDSEGTCCPNNSLAQGLNNNILNIIGEPLTQNYCSVTVSVEASAEGSDFNCSADPCSAFTGADAFSIQVDFGGGFQQLGSYCGDQADGSFSFTFESLEVGALPIFQITGGVPSENSTYVLDNFRIEGIPSSFQEPSISAPDDITKLCEGTDVLLLTALPFDPNFTYNWQNSNIGSLSETGATYTTGSTVTPQDGGLYTVTITETAGCTSVASIEIEVISASQKDVESKFPVFSTRKCVASPPLALPVVSVTDMREGVWNVPNPLDLTTVSDSSLLIFTYDDNGEMDSIYIRLDTVPAVTNLNLAPSETVSICATTQNPFVNLIELLDLNFENIQDIFAFGRSGFSLGELMAYDISSELIGPDMINISSIQNGECIGISTNIPIELDFINTGHDTSLNICITSPQYLDFINFEELTGTENAEGQWINPPNANVDLSFPDGVLIDQLDAGIYSFEFEVSTPNICGDLIMNNTVLNLIIEDPITLEILTPDVLISCNELSTQVDFLFTMPSTNYFIDLALIGENGVEQLGEFTSIEEAHFLNIETTDLTNRIEGTTLFLNPSLSAFYELRANSWRSEANVLCSNFDIIDDAIMITFDNIDIEPIEIDTNFCMGDVFLFKGVEYTTDLIDEIITISSPEGCDTIYELNATFQAAIEMPVLAEICDGQEFDFKGLQTFTTAANDVAFSVPGTVGCDTTFFVSVVVLENELVELEIDPCISDGLFKGQDINVDTLIIVQSTGAGCDTIFDIAYAPTVAPDSLFQDERCDNDPLTLNGVTYTPDNNTGMFDIVTAEGCEQRINVLVDFESGVFKDLDTMICNGTTVEVGGMTFDEVNFEGEVLLGQSSTGCDSILFVSLEFIESEEVEVPVSICNGQSITLFGIEVTENTSLTEQFFIGPNTCDTVLTFDVNVGSLDADLNSMSTCTAESNGQVTISEINGAAPYVVSLDDQTMITDDPNIVFSDLSAGDYEVIISDANGCEFTSSIVVAENDLSLSFTSSPNVQAGLDLVINSDQNIVSVAWSPSIGLNCDDCLNPTANPESTQTYTVTAFDDNGCMSTLDILVTVNNVEPDVPNYYLPTALSVGSANNGSLYLQTSSGLINSYNMQVFNRYGERVYAINNALPNDPNIGWDGRIRNTSLNPGVYVYRVEILLATGSTEIATGDVLVVK